MELHVATRKGLFTVRPDADDAVSTPSFLGDPVTSVLHDRRDGTLYAALNLGHFGRKLHRCDLGGTCEPGLREEGGRRGRAERVADLDAGAGR